VIFSDFVTDRVSVLESNIDDVDHMPDEPYSDEKHGLQVGTWLFDYATETLTWSRGTHQIFGTSPDSFSGKSADFLEIVHADDRQRVLDAIKQSESGVGSFDLKFRIQRPDGRERVVHESGEILFGRDGLPISNSGVVVDVTESSEAEEKSRRASALADMAARISSLGGWSIDIASGRVTWSDRVCAIHGVPRGTRPTVETATGFVAAEYRNGVIDAMTRCVEQGRPFDVEVQITTSAHERVWVRIIGEALRDDTGTITSVQGAIQDLTSWKQLESSLDASQRRMRQLADAMPMIVWSARPDGLVDFVNQRLLDYIGASYAGSTGPLWMEAVHPDDLTSVYQAWAAVSETGAPYEHEFRLRRHDGQYRWHIASAVAGRDDSGAISRWYGSALDIHERRQMTADLRATTNRLTTTLESISDAFYTVDREWTFTYVNGQAERLIQRSRDELLGNNLWELYPDTVGTNVHRQFLGAMASGNAIELEEYIAPLDKWLSINAYPSSEGLAVYFRDVSESREVDMRLRLLDAAISRMNDIVLITEASSLDELGPKISFVNEAFETLTGYSRDEALGKSPRLLQGAGTDREELDRIRAALEARSPIRAEVLNYTKDREEIWLDMDIVPITDRRGTLTHFLSVQRNVTHRKKIEDELREREERFRSVAKVTADTIWDWDLKTDQVWWGDGLKTQFGIDPDTISQKVDSWSSGIHPDDRNRVLESVFNTIGDGGERWEQEYRFRRADGSYARVVDRGYVLRDDNGQAIRMVGGLSDVSAARALEARMWQVQKLDSIGQLTGGVAHDFNNLLTVILGNAEALADGLESDATFGPMAATTVRAAERGAELTNQLLAFARQQALEPRAIDPGEAIFRVEAMLRRTLSEDIEISIPPIDPDLWPAFADAAQLESVLLNLALNARDAMPEGGRLTIEASNTSLHADDIADGDDLRAGSYVMLAVSDNGIGMPPEILARVFEPFFTTKSFGTGSGLGLSMVYGYAKQSNGYVRIYSEVGQGTTVRLFLPRAPGGELQYDVGTTEQEPEGGSERILVVEDDRMVREFVAGQLASLGYTVTCAGSETEALEALRRHAGFALLFTDVVMPGGMSGKQLAEEASGLYPEMAVLFTSGYTENAIVHNGRLDKGVALLNKPYSRRQLAQKVRATLDLRRK
jgi:PAS domain S-box-containing protein